MKKAMSALSVIVVVTVLVATTPSLAWARSGHHGGKSHHGVSRHHGGSRHHHHRFHHHGSHHHRFHHHRGFVGSSVFFVAPFSYPSSGYSPPVYIPAPEGYWYYCQSAGAYYPYVQTCPEPWLRVVPRAR